MAGVRGCGVPGKPRATTIVAIPEPHLRVAVAGVLLACKGIERALAWGKHDAVTNHLESIRDVMDVLSTQIEECPTAVKSET